MFSDPFLVELFHVCDEACPRWREQNRFRGIILQDMGHAEMEGCCCMEITLDQKTSKWR